MILFYKFLFSASRYAIKVICGKENTTQCNIHEVIEVLYNSPQLNYGKEQQLKIKIIDKTQILSIRIIAFNEKNKSSDLSNIVEIFRPSKTLPEITTEEPAVTKLGIIVGWVIGGVLIIICILGVVVYFRRKQKDKQPELNNTEENRDNHKIKPTFLATDIPPMKTATVKRIESFPVLLYTHDQIKDFKNKENDQPLHKSNVPPKQWKSLDVISMLEKKGDKDTKSLGSSSTVNIEEDNNKKL